LGPGNARRLRDRAAAAQGAALFRIPNGPGRVARTLTGRRASHAEGPGQRRSMKTNRIPLAVLLAISGIALADDGDAPKDHPAKFKITTRRKDDAVEVRADMDKTLFTVKSPFGISRAVIERADDKWPEVVVLRLHLKGLSSFR